MASVTTPVSMMTVSPPMNENELAVAMTSVAPVPPVRLNNKRTFGVVARESVTSAPTTVTVVPLIETGTSMPAWLALPSA